MITIKVNDKNKKVFQDSTVGQLVEQLNIQTNGIAIAVNNNVVAKTNWNKSTLSENDTILIIKSTQGG